MPALIEARSVSLEAAHRAAAGAVKKATSMGLAVCVAVVDRAGHLISFDRMDGAPLLCAELAQDKAYTVASYGLPSHEWWPAIKDDPALVHGLIKTDRFIVYGGGAPILKGEELVGAIGVSGGSHDQDREIAESGATTCSNLFQK